MDGSETSVVLEHLSSLTEYQLAVFAVYANEASEALRGSETTRKFILTHKHARRNACTKPRSNASVNIWDHQLITMAAKFDSHGSQTYWQWCTHNTRIRFLDFHSDPANTVCCDIITMYKTHQTWFIIMIPPWLNHAVCLSVCGRVCVCVCVWSGPPNSDGPPAVRCNSQHHDSKMGPCGGSRWLHAAVCTTFTWRGVGREGGIERMMKKQRTK